MAPLINTTNKTRVWINGIDVTTAVIRGSVTDNSAIGAALILSTGEIECSNWAGNQNMLDVGRTTFPIGSSVLIATELPNGNFVRHPRGLLYVMNSNVNIEQRTINFRIGCSLALLAENENAYPGAVEQLWAFVSPAILSSCVIEDRSLSGLNSALMVEGKALYQNAYGQVWAVSMLDTGDSGAPALVVTDKHTAISIASNEDPSVIAPASFNITTTYGIFRRVDPDPDDERSGVDNGDGSGEPEIDGERAPVDDDDGTDPALTGPYRKWSNQVVNSYGQYDKMESWDLTVYSGMKLPEERDDGMYIDWCSWFYSYRPEPEPPAEPSWAYGIETNEVITVTQDYPNRVVSSTTKFYNANGQETGSIAVEQATWKAIGQSTIDIGVDRAKQYSDYWLEVAQDCLGKINTALTSRDEHPRGSSANNYYQCVHLHWVARANDALGLARGWFYYAAQLKDSGMTSCWSKRSVVTNEYGTGGEVVKKVTQNYENERTTQIYQESLKQRLEKGELLSVSLLGPGNLVEVSQQIEQVIYNNDGSARTVTSVIDLQDPSRNSVTVSWDGDSRNAPPLTTGGKKANNNKPSTDEDGVPTESIPGQSPIEDPNNPGQYLPYPREWDGRLVDPVTGKLGGLADCPVEVVNIDLKARVPGLLGNTPSQGAGWLGNQQSYVSEVAFPLSFKGDVLEADYLGSCIPVRASMATATSLLNQYAQIYAAQERGKDGGFSISEPMRAEMYNLRPLSRVDVQLQTLGIGYRCRIDNCVWAFDQNQSLVNMNVFKVASFVYNVAPSAPVYNVPVLPPNQEVVATVLQTTPTWAYTDPYGGATNGTAPPAPDLIDGTGTPVDPTDVPSTDADLVPLAPVSLSQFVYPRLVLNASISKVDGYSWNYGGIGLPMGMPLDLGTISAPYYKDYDFTGIVTYNEPVPLP